MAYPIYYPSDCDSQVPDHLCSDCDATEFGRVRSVAFIRKDFSFTDPTNPVEWANGIANKQIIIIPEVNGTFDGGKATTGDGYGDQVTKLLGYTFTLEYKDPNYAANAAFYNGILKSRNYRVAYKTETQVHLSVSTVQVIPTNPVTNKTTDEVVYDVQVLWADEFLPVPEDAPESIFECFNYTPQ